MGPEAGIEWPVWACVIYYLLLELQMPPSTGQKETLPETLKKQTGGEEG